MSDSKFNLTPRQKFFRGLVFLTVGAFLIIQFIAGENPDPALVYFSWMLAGAAFAAMLGFIWSMRQKQ